MKTQILYTIESECLAEQELLRYAEGSADAELTRKVELHLSDCVMCSDALEGLQNTDNQQFIETNESVKSKIKAKYAPTKIVPMRRYLPWAAAASLLIGLVFWFWNSPKNSENLVVSNEKKQDILSTISQNDAKIDLENDANLADLKLPIKHFPVFKSKKNSTISTITKSNNADIVANEQETVPIAKTEENTTKVADNQAIVSGETKLIKTEPAAETAKSSYGYYVDLENKEVEKKAEKDAAKSDDKIAATPTVAPNNSNNDYQQNSNNGINMPLPAPIQNNNISSSKNKSIYKKQSAETAKPSAKSNANAKQNIQFADQEQRLLDQGVKQYIASNYKEALATFETVLKQFPKSEAAIFYKGATQCADNQCIEGINTLSTFVSSYPETSVFYSESAWLTANCQVSLMQRETAKLLLQQLADYNNPHQDDAKRLLEKLRN